MCSSFQLGRISQALPGMSFCLPDAVIFHEAADAPPEEMTSRTCHPAPFAQLAKEAGATEIKRTSSLSVVCHCAIWALSF